MAEPIESKTKCLLVDDHAMMREGLMQLLEDAGFEVDTAANGMEAMDCINARSYGVIVTDITMPVWSGFDLLEALKAQQLNIPVVVLTVHSDSGFRRRAETLGAFAYVQKDSPSDELVRVLNAAVTHGQKRASAARRPVTTTTGPRVVHPPSRRRSKSSVSPDASSSVYPYLVGGLLHDAMNTLQAMTFWEKALSETLFTDANGHQQRAVEGITRGLNHLRRVLAVLQDSTRAYYDAERIKQEGESLSELLDHARRDHPDIRYEHHGSTSLHDMPLPLGFMMFVCGELLANASKACIGVDKAVISLSITSPIGDNTLCIECRDNGPGLPEAILQSIQSGTLRHPSGVGAAGYGLYFISQIVDRLNGRVLASNLDPTGARLELLLPLKRPRL